VPERDGVDIDFANEDGLERVSDLGGLFQPPYHRLRRLVMRGDVIEAVTLGIAEIEWVSLWRSPGAALQVSRRRVWIWWWGDLYAPGIDYLGPAFAGELLEPGDAAIARAPELEAASGAAFALVAGGAQRILGTLP